MKKKSWIKILSIGSALVISLELYLRYKDKKHWDAVEESIPYEKAKNS